MIVEVSKEEFAPWLICEVVEEGLQATVYDFDNYMRIEPVFCDKVARLGSVHQGERIDVSGHLRRTCVWN